MTESEFAAALRSCPRETEAEHAARLAPVAEEMEHIHHVEYFVAEDRWNHRETVGVM